MVDNQHLIFKRLLHHHPHLGLGNLQCVLFLLPDLDLQEQGKHILLVLELLTESRYTVFLFLNTQLFSISILDLFIIHRLIIQMDPIRRRTYLQEYQTNLVNITWEQHPAYDLTHR